MSIRFNKRINLGKGIGVNISKSGITPSVKTKIGSVSSKGYSVRTGIPGITYRKTYSKSKNSGCLIILIFFIASITFLTIASCKNEIIKSTNQWYQVGTLHNSNISDWKYATEENKLATCGEFCANIYKDHSIDYIKIIATNLKICIDEAVKGHDVVNNSAISEMATYCLLLMENLN
ncbi:DUF4236 domain-containing protein [Mariniflexile soesokkakense]|uniref:DUF4236 domain-containing protein n=1 Tax=Mariniflexile soesokkakense TaxID=1343160 RepID=A0ABV0A9C5_9FLAO